MFVTIDASGNVSARNGHEWCLFCGAKNPESFGLCFKRETDGTVYTRFQGYGNLQGYDGILHGGVIASLLDVAMTHCLFHQGIQAVTGDLHVRYVRLISCGAVLDIRARVLSSVPPLYRLKADIIVENRVAAWAEAKFMRRRKS